MSKWNKQLVTIRLLTLCVLASLVFFLTASIRTGQDGGAEVVNMTQSFQVVSAVKSNNSFHLLLKNNYSKAINGYSVGANPTSVQDIDLTIGDSEIAPGDSTRAEVPIPDSQSVSGGVVSPQKVYVFAVFFDDGSSDGDRLTINRTRQRRLGIKIQLNRILPLIQAALNSSDSDMPETISRLKSQILSLPEETETGQPAMVRSGLLSAKRTTLTEIQRIEEEVKLGRIKYREGLIHVKANVERRSTRL